MAIVNLRFLDAGVAKLKTEGEENSKLLRRAIGTKSVTRLGIITVIGWRSSSSTARSALEPSPDW